MKNTIIAELAELYPQLYLDPDTRSQEYYKEVVLKGVIPDNRDLSFFCDDPRDKEEMLDTPVGKVRTVTFYNRGDFEKFLRCMMAAKVGPEKQIPSNQGAATITAFNWYKINKHREQFLKEQYDAGNMTPDWGLEFKKFLLFKENYVDTLVVLSAGPYSAVDAGIMGCTDEEWLGYSDTIRKYHELTHVICRAQYPDQIDPVWDELAADAIGLYAAYHEFDPDKERIFLGIKDGTYIGGRLENYTDRPNEIAARADHALDGIDGIIRQHMGTEPFSLIPYIQSEQKTLFF